MFNTIFSTVRGDAGFHLFSAGHIAIMITSFILPPTGQIDPSVLMGTSILIMGYEWLFGHSIKSVNIDKTGIHIETFHKGE